jgi:hypothetical protein
MSNKDAMPLSSEINEVVVCYLCLDGGDDKSDQPLRRDCACRGTDAGFVHLACITEYAETKSKGWNGRSMNEFVNPWEFCPGCHQLYQNMLRIDIATEFVSFVRRQYPEDTPKQVESRAVKLCALMDMFDRLKPVQKKEAGVTANVILSLIDRMKNDAPPLPERYLSFQAFAYGTLGRIVSTEGTIESARRAVTHVEKQLEVYETIGDDEGIAVAKGNIAIAKSKFQGGNNNEMLKASEELYEMRVAQIGEVSEYTIRAGKSYAINLREANRGDEARELLTKLQATSKQVLGPDHKTTKEIESELKKK